MKCTEWTGILLAACIVPVCFAAVFNVAGKAETIWGRRAIQTAQVPGPLRVHSTNPRYFADPAGKPVYLTGWNVWGNLQDGHGTAWRYGWGNPFDFQAYLESLSSHRLNYMRLWMYETAMMTFSKTSGRFAGAPTEYPSPLPWRRTGPGLANDGKPRFDLTHFDSSYFDRMRSRVLAAGARGIYVSVMLFEGFSIKRGQDGEYDGWIGHPMNAANNINGIDGDPDRDGSGNEIHTLGMPAVTRLQEVYVRKVIATVNDLDHVLYEVSNESDGTPEWQYHIIDFIRRTEAGLEKKHPVQMTGAGRMKNSDLFASAAEAIGPGGGDRREYLSESPDGPPAADGTKVILADTDHMGALLDHAGPERNRAWVWRSFTRGHNPSLLVSEPGLAGGREGIRALRDARRYAERINLAGMMPRGDLVSTGFCLAKPGREYLVYMPEGGEAILDLTSVSGSLTVEWFNPKTSASTSGGTLEGGRKRFVKAPFDGDAVLHVRSDEK